MKTLLALMSLNFLFLSACVVTPDGTVLAPPVDVDASVGVGIEPRIYTSSGMSVSIWLPSAYVVADAYPVAQRYCSRWGMWARPSMDWTYSSPSARHLDYTCVRARPYLAYPHIRRGGRYYSYPRRRPVYTPKPAPSYRKRKTFGGAFNKGDYDHRKSVEPGKPWEHNTKKKGVFSPRPTPPPSVSLEPGKPWEHKEKRSVFSSGRKGRLGNLDGKRKNTSTYKREKNKNKKSSFGFGKLTTPSSRGSLRSKSIEKRPSKRSTFSL